MLAEPPSTPGAAGPSSWVTTGTTRQHPIVAVHTWRDEDRHYERLSAAMGGVGIVSLLPPSSDAARLPRRTDQWVDHHHALLSTIPIDPPYQLVGWSYGGVVALELARRLKAEGRDVSFVGMIDSMRPRLLPLSTREYVWHHLGVAATMDDVRLRRAYLEKRGKFLLNRSFPKVRAAVRPALVRAGLRAPRPDAVPAKPTDPLVVSVHTSYLNYRGAAVPFPVSLYATQESVDRALDPALRWSTWLRGGYELTQVPGEHFTIWHDEHVGELARSLACSLSRVRDGAPR